ncbi:hypothetical protein D3C76_316330 [compost metagenome]
MRKQMQVYSPIKNIVQELKKELNLKNESEVIAYLYCIYKQNKKSRKTITLEEHKQTLEEIENILQEI